MASTNNPPLLDLQTKIDRKHIDIDGKHYPLRSLAEFSLMERHDMAAHGRAMQGLSQLGEDEAAARAAIEKAALSLHETFLRIVVDGDEIAGKLTDEHKLTVLNCFFAQAGLQASPNGSTTKSSKRRQGSKDSTAATRKAG